MNGSASRCLRRLQKERKDLDKVSSLKYELDEKNPYIMKLFFSGAEDTLYTGEDFTLQFKFNEEYVIFIYQLKLSN